ncbi:MAG: hypothetical protein JWO87_753 [Phycisphaerales bacterium]|nr:hypothetical protein [Phycisphaerales bacterium]
MTNPEIDRQPLPTLPLRDEPAKLPWESIDPEEPAAALAAAQPQKMPHPAAAPARAVAAAAAHPEQAIPPADEYSDEHLSVQAFLGDDETATTRDTLADERSRMPSQSAPRPKWTGALSADEGSAPDPAAEEAAPILNGTQSDPGIEQPMQAWADAADPMPVELPVEAPARASIDLPGPDDESVGQLWAGPGELEEAEVVAKAPAATLLAPAAMAPAAPAARTVPAAPAVSASAAPVIATSDSEAAEDDDIDDSDDGEEEADEFADADDTADALGELQSTGGGWTIPLLCLGIGLIACCIVIPQADVNGRLFYERQMLQADLESVEKQVAVNGEFIKRVMDDPTLAERLAGRQLKTIRKGQKVLALKHEPADTDMSPFALVTVAPPALPPPYKPVGGGFASLCYDARSRLYLMGAAMTMIAAGLVLGVGPRKMP